jgi:high-affinity Fe2+/Pb2+ permease
MAQRVPTQHEMIPVTQSSRGVASVIVVAGAGLAAALLLGAVVLWYHYGTAVFFEIIASGIAACF